MATSKKKAILPKPLKKAVGDYRHGDLPQSRAGCGGAAGGEAGRP